MSFVLKTVAQLESTRPEIADFVGEIEKAFAKGERIVAVTAPVKSGKRTIKILFNERNKRNAANLYIGALNRKDEKEQLDELEEYGIDVFSTKGDDVPRLKNTLKVLEKKVDVIYVHFNESDYGTGNQQSLSNVFHHLVKHDKVRMICYSATNEEMLCGKLPHIHLLYTPPKAYRGALHYLNSGLVTEAEPFWDRKKGVLSVQGAECVQVLKTSSKLFGVIRIASGLTELRRNGKFDKEMSKQGIIVRYVTGQANESFDWSDRDTGDFWRYVGQQTQKPDLKVLLVLNQTCTRSTEVMFHKHIAFWHDYRSGNTPYNTIIQAIGRVYHYLPKGEVENTIKTYTQIDALQCEAGLITLEQYDRKLNGRVKTDIDRSQFDYDFVHFDSKPTRQQINEAYEERGLLAKGGRVNPLTASKNIAADLVSVWVGKTQAPCAHKPELDNVLYLDEASPAFPMSWVKYVAANGLKGKYILLILVPKTERRANEHKTVRSVYA